MKKCSKCGALKNLSDFYKNNNTKDKYTSYCKKCSIEHSGNWHKNNKEKKTQLMREGNYKRKYGITTEQYNKIFKYQKGCCAICGKHQKIFKRSFAVDHCHSTGEVRGLLCMNCNTAIGKFNDDVSLVLKAAAYLTNPPYEDKDE